MPAQDHPLWPIIRLSVLMVAMCVVLWLNASNFDITEIRSIITVFIVAAGGEGLAKLLNRSQGTLQLRDGQRVDSASYWRGVRDAGESDIPRG